MWVQCYCLRWSLFESAAQCDFWRFNSVSLKVSGWTWKWYLTSLNLNAMWFGLLCHVCLQTQRINTTPEMWRGFYRMMLSWKATWHGEFMLSMMPWKWLMRVFSGGKSLVWMVGSHAENLLISHWPKVGLDFLYDTKLIANNILFQISYVANPFFNAFNDANICKC